LEEKMTRRFAALLIALSVLALGSNTRLFAHEGHDHKVMGTVTMAMADHIMVMKDGRMVEQGAPDEVLDNPREPYTRRLMEAAFGDRV
jgi:ABC-type microcin C transport system duplicated ATPase subunit YejF